jgi:hypothetical protein
MDKSIVWDSGPGKFMAQYLNATLRLPDRMLMEAHYQSHLLGLMKLNKTTIATEEMKESALAFAARKTFNDNTKVAKALAGVKKALNFGFRWGLGDLVIKFTNVTGNLITRTVEYSPLSMFRVGYHLVSVVKQSKDEGISYRDAFVQHQSQIANSLADSVVGTSVIALGMVLRSLGLITGDPDDDTDKKNLMRTLGLGEYKLNLTGLKRFILSGFNPAAAKLQPGDELASYDWAAPISIGLSMGSNIADANRKGKTGTAKTLSLVNTFVSSFSAGMQTLADQPVFSGIQRFMSNRDGIVDAIVGAAQSAPATFIPAVFKYIRDMVDNTTGSTYDSNWVQAIWYQIQNKIPGLHLNVPVYFDPFGNAKTTQQAGNSFYNVFLNPANMSKFKPSPEAMLAIDIMTEDSTVIPRVAPKKFDMKVNGATRTYELTGIELSQFQKTLGGITKRGFEQIVQLRKDGAYADDAAVAKDMNKVLTAATKAAKEEAVRNRGIAGLPEPKPKTDLYDPVLSD